ncbi:type II secretion system protein [Deinococcus deserti]|uniref:Putative type II secretion system protein, pseudopilin n=1 Tax=Deinococcus deserti (strain DSM 17065 / CIP 109153 / LMG 22923 / VCD115) TaxID=546414 RepID=C1D0Y6_DEIDV|nr:type II secretion system protein [Deinococcus deserti]ACO45510.1 putative type II secretion system protein, pseudopilin [Deinococcus deserti VCD115]
MMMRDTQSGFTLIEILVSMAIFAIISASVMTFLPALTKSNGATNDQQRVTLVAKAFFEEARSRLRTNFADTLSTVTVPTNDNGLICTKSMSTLHSDLKRVKLSCALNSKTYTFSLDVGVGS